MIKCEDFVPKMLSQPGLFKEGEYETFEDAVVAANAWVKENNVKVVNFETVVLPNIWRRYEEGSTDVSLGTSGDMVSRWHQFIRVWYEVDTTQE